MYKHYLILCFCIEESDTWEFIVLVTEFELVAFSVFCFVCLSAKILITIICCI